MHYKALEKLLENRKTQQFSPRRFILKNVTGDGFLSLERIACIVWCHLLRKKVTELTSQ